MEYHWIYIIVHHSQNSVFIFVLRIWWIVFVDNTSKTANNIQYWSKCTCTVWISMKYHSSIILKWWKVFGLLPIYESGVQQVSESSPTVFIMKMHSIVRTVLEVFLTWRFYFKITLVCIDLWFSAFFQKNSGEVDGHWKLRPSLGSLFRFLHRFPISYRITGFIWKLLVMYSVQIIIISYGANKEIQGSK